MTDNEMISQYTTALNNALTISKIYIDNGDQAVKDYVDSQLETTLQTTDLTAKLALLEQINNILDGDNATAGFQAWQSSVNDLIDLRTRMTAAEGSIATHTAQIAAVTANLATLSASISGMIDTAVDAATDALTTRLDQTDADVAAVSAQIIADKAAQVTKDAEQSAAIAANTATAASLSSSLATEITDRAAADATTTTRVAAAEALIAANTTAINDRVTKAQMVAFAAAITAGAQSVFNLNVDGTTYTP